MKIIAMIPARYEASRFPGKLMKMLNGKTVIEQTYNNALAMGVFEKVYVVTDSEIIFDKIEAVGGNAIMTSPDHECGSDRIAEAVQNVACDIVVNVQGDEPFVHKEAIQSLLEVFKTDQKKQIDLASIMHRIKDKQEIENPNNVKVIVDNENFALYFSRSPIPFPRDENSTKYFKHQGIYAFRKEAIISFSEMPMHYLEASEKIECIRYLEHRKSIKMVETNHVSVGIDTPEDLEQAKLLFKNK